MIAAIGTSAAIVDLAGGARLRLCESSGVDQEHIGPSTLYTVHVESVCIGSPPANPQHAVCRLHSFAT
jgi:hypothetical protein